MTAPRPPATASTAGSSVSSSRATSASVGTSSSRRSSSRSSPSRCDLLGVALPPHQLRRRRQLDPRREVRSAPPARTGTAPRTRRPTTAARAAAGSTRRGAGRRRRRSVAAGAGDEPDSVCGDASARCSRSRADLREHVRRRRRSAPTPSPLPAPAARVVERRRPASRPARRTRPGGRSARPPIPFSPAASVSRWPARLPLSTVETYSGRSGSSVRVSYQLNRCPR